MITDHTKLLHGGKALAPQTVLTLLKQFEGQAQDPRLKSMISKAEPIVQRHLTHAQAVDAKLAAPAA